MRVSMRYQPAHACLTLHFKSVFEKIWIFFCFELICFWYFQIILMCWYQKWFLKNKKKILLAYFSEWKALWKATTTTTTLPNTHHGAIAHVGCYDVNLVTIHKHPDIAGCKVGVLVEVWDLNLEMQVTLVFFSVFFFERWTNTEFPCSWS
jgi:hypothetical protein